MNGVEVCGNLFGRTTYEFFGRRYIFDIYIAKNRAHFLWCKTGKKWALLYPSMVRFENESVILAKCVKNDLKNGHLPTFCPLLKCKSGLNACLLRSSKIAKNRVFGVFLGCFWGVLAILRGFESLYVLLKPICPFFLLLSI